MNIKRVFTASVLTIALAVLSCPPSAYAGRSAGSRRCVHSCDTLWGAYCYREVKGYTSGSSRMKCPFTHFPLRPQEVMVYYVLAEPCTATITLLANTNKGIQGTIDAKITEVNSGNIIAQKVLMRKFKGGQERLTIMKGRKLPSKSWYKIELSCTNKYALHSVDYWLIEHNSHTPIKPSPIFMAPSVHLNGWQSTDTAAPQGEAYDWAYMEVMLPKEFERRNTYVMSLGILSGYMGIQTIDEQYNRNFRHRVLFSMWDNGDTDRDFHLPAHLRSCSLDWADNVKINRFGGEGTGTQAIIYDAPWQCDEWIQFIATCRPECSRIKVKNHLGQDTIIEHQSTLVSAWYKQARDNEWHYLATHRESGYNHYISGWYSFLENFTDEGGNSYRRAYYRNGFLHSLSDNRWYQRNKVGFGHTQGNEQQPRYDYGHGATAKYPNTFYLEQGGYTLEANDSAAVLPLGADQTAVDTINLNALWQRMEKAVMREATSRMDARIAEAAEASDKLAAFKTLAKEQLDNAGLFGYYAEEDLSDLRSVYRDGQTDDAAELALFLRQLAMFANPLKYGEVAKAEHIGNERAYQILSTDGTTLSADNTPPKATNAACNWHFIRQGSNSDKFLIRNIGTGQYLQTDGSVLTFTDEPAIVTLTDRGGKISIGGIPCVLIDNYYVEPDYQKR